MNNADRRFNLYFICLIFLFLVILILRWRWMPTFIDIYYHLLTMLNFGESGGFTSVSLWEYAPFGRPQLYPPLLHILMLIVFKLKPSVLFVARIFELVSFPLVLTIIFVAIKSMFDARKAFWSVLIAASMYSFYLSCVDFLAASLAFCLGLLVFSSLEKNKFLAAASFLALCLYSHVSVSLFFVLALIIYGLLRREKLRIILIINIAALIIYLPLLIHQVSHLSFIDLGSPLENFPFELNIIVYLLAGFGVYLALLRRKENAFFIAIALATLPFLFLRYRFLSGQGMIGIILLASLTLDFFYEKFYSLASKERRYGPIVIYTALLFSGLFLFSPSITIKDSRANFSLFGSTYINIIPTQEIRERTNEISIYLPKSFQPVFDIVEKETGPRDLIASNFEYLAGFIATFTDRATTSAMLKEVKPFKEINPFKYAKLIIWLKDPERMSQEPLDLIRNLGLKKTAETEVFFIYKNPEASVVRDYSGASLPLGICALALLSLLTLAVVDLVWRRD